MYHGQVMVEQDRIPQLLQTAQLLEVRGLCEIKEGQSASTKDEKEGGTSGMKENQSFLAGLLNTNISATKRCASVSDTNSCSNSSPIPSPVAKRQRSSGGSSRPVPMLQSILSQQLAVPTIPTFDLTAKSMGSSTRALTALASKVQANSSQTSSSTTNSNSVNIHPTSLENLLNLSSVVMAAASSGNHNNGADISATSSSDEDMNEKDDKVESSFGDMENSCHGGPDIEPDTVVEIKEEPLVDFEDEFGEDNSPHGAGGGEVSGDDESESETELGAMSESSRGEAFSLPLLAQHLAAPTNLLSASAKLRAAASQARHLSSSSSDSMTQVMMGPSTPPDSGPAAMSTRADTASPSKLELEFPSSLFFRLRTTKLFYLSP